MKSIIKLKRHPARAECRVFFTYTNSLLRTVLLAAGVRWDAERRSYWLADTPEALAQLKAAGELAGQVVILPEELLAAAPADEYQPEAAQYHTLFARFTLGIRSENYSAKTLRSYQQVFQAFLLYHLPVVPLSLTASQIQAYLTYRSTAGLSASYLNTMINAIRFYYEKVEGQPLKAHVLVRPKRLEKHPKILVRAEVKALLEQTPHLKHRALLMLAYGLGLRPKEILSLNRADFDQQRQLLRVRHPKSGKARYLRLPTTLTEVLREQLHINAPVQFLFEGQTAGTPYSERGLQYAVRQAAIRAGIRRPVTAQMLRHSYATHLLEGGATIRTVQDMLGHASSKTTEVYTSVARQARPVSPLDSLELNR